MRAVDRKARAVCTLFDQWSQLPLWRGDFKSVCLRIERRRGRCHWSTGHALVEPWPSRKIKMSVRLGRDFGDAAAALLHEMAHVAVYKDKAEDWYRHRKDGSWRRMYKAAVFAICGAHVDGRSYQALDRAVGRALCAHLGQRFA